MQRLRDELQRRETALHRAQAQSASQSRELDIALQELEQLRAREEEDREVQGDGEEEEGSGNEGEEDDPPLEEVSHERVCMYKCMLYTVLWVYMYFSRVKSLTVKLNVVTTKEFV